jgi:hypothetical protein
MTLYVGNMISDKDNIDTKQWDGMEFRLCSG